MTDKTVTMTDKSLLVLTLKKKKEAELFKIIQMLIKNSDL